MKIGYARVSTKDQNLSLQTDALEKYGCEELFFEKASGTKANRPELQRMLKYVRKGDTVVIWKLDRLGRSISDLIQIVNQLKGKGVAFVSLKDNFDTNTSGGKLIFHIMAALAEFERDMISERTKAGLEAAKARGRRGGRPRGMSERLKKIAPAVKAVYDSGQLKNKEICKQFGISVGTIYRLIEYVKQLEIEKRNKELDNLDNTEAEESEVS